MWTHEGEDPTEYRGRLLDRIADLEIRNKKLQVALDEATVIIINAVNAFPSISAQEWLDKQEGK